MARTAVPSTACYVIVGAGSAGAVLANRLSEDPGSTVVLVEAGGEAKSFLVELPVGFAKTINNPKFDWCYEQEADESLNGRRWVWSAGRLLGGSSSINGQVYIRGTRHDFDLWAQQGATGWSFDEIFPYFLRSEHWHGAPSQAHGATGPLSVSPIRDPHPLTATFLEACRETGLPTLAEYNDGSAFGAFLTQANQKDGWRCSTEKGYLRPVRGRPNLHVLTNAEVETITIVDGRAVGVILVRGGQRESIAATREVVVCAGALGSPAMLMRSGVGPGEYLRKHGINVIYNAPEVGQNLQEHSGVATSRFVNVPTLNSQTGPVDMVKHMAKFLWNRTGPMSSPAIQAMSFAKTRADLVEPDIQLHFTPLAATVDETTASPAAATMDGDPAVTIYVSLCKPKGRGRVELGERGLPRIIHQLVGNDDDRATLVDGLRLASGIFETPAFQRIVTGFRKPEAEPKNDQGWVDHIRATANITWHPAGTCRMGADKGSVVDAQLRVRGVAALRVVDASIMPTITSGNTNAATIMIGEKAAEMIRRAD